MKWIPPRDYVLFAVAMIAVTIAITAAMTASFLPIQVAEINEVLDALSLTQIGIGIAIVFLSLVFLRSLYGAPGTVNRSQITSETPETASNQGVRNPTEPLAEAYSDVIRAFNQPASVERRIAMYGRRAAAYEDLPEPHQQFFDEIAITARDTHATSSITTSEAAETAIQTGSWTDDRIAAAFLATDVETAPTFTVIERITAWFAPKRAFTHRLNRVFEAIEIKADGYLTYSKPENKTASQTIEEPVLENE